MERLQKIMAARGLASRRGAEALILAGAVQVNGEVVTQLGTRVSEDAEIRVNRQVLQQTRDARLTLMLHKPVGYVTTQSNNEGPALPQLLQGHPRQIDLQAAGRLDKDSSGLLLLTTDGQLRYAVMSPDNKMEKEYLVWTANKDRPGTPPTASQLQKMADGIMLDGVRTQPCQITAMGEDGFRIVLREGRNRQIRRMAAKVGLGVIDLKRIRIGPLRLGDLKPGRYRELKSEELTAVYEEAGLSWQP